MSLLRELMR